MGKNVLEYWVDQRDYNFDGHRDFAVWFDYAESKRVFLWSEKQGKYVHEPFFDSLESPTLFKDARCIVNNRHINEERTEYYMYQYDGQHYHLISTLVQRGYTSENLLLILYDASGKRVREIQKPTFQQLTPLWQKDTLIDYLGY